MKELVKIWKDSVNWNQMNREQKRVAMKFGLSASLTFVFCGTWLAIPFAVSTIYYTKQLEKKKVKIEE